MISAAIVGGTGYTGEIKKGILPKDYPDLDTRRAQINIVQGGDCLLPGFSAQASKKAEDFLIESLKNKSTDSINKNKR